MHNVKKTPATEAHNIKEKRKREEKLKLFVSLKNKIFEKRDNGLRKIYIFFKQNYFRSI